MKDRVDEIIANIKINDYVNEKKEDLAHVARLTEFIRKRDEKQRQKESGTGLGTWGIVAIVFASVLSVIAIAIGIYLILGRKVEDYFDDSLDDGFDDFFVDEDDEDEDEDDSEEEDYFDEEDESFDEAGEAEAEAPAEE